MKWFQDAGIEASACARKLRLRLRLDSPASEHHCPLAGTHGKEGVDPNSFFRLKKYSTTGHKLKLYTRRSKSELRKNFFQPASGPTLEQATRSSGQVGDSQHFQEPTQPMWKVGQLKRPPSQAWPRQSVNKIRHDWPVFKLSIRLWLFRGPGQWGDMASTSL